MGYPSSVTRGFQLSSGRVIALGRLLMAGLLIVAIRIDVTQPGHASRDVYEILIGYVGYSAVLVLLTWRNWWLDAKLAGPAHAVDIALFTAVGFLTEAYTSPFFIFFVFLLLSAAIRWGWRETALTAILLTLLYMVVGVIAAKLGGPHFEIYRFLVRADDLIILSLILIWFGINRWDERSAPRESGTSPIISGGSAIDTSLLSASEALRSSKGIFIWRDIGSDEAAAHFIRDGDVKVDILKKPLALPNRSEPILYNIKKRRALTSDGHGALVTKPLDELVAPETAAALNLTDGITIQIQTQTGEGTLFLESIRHVSTDDVALAGQVALDVAANIQRNALVRAAEESAEGRSRMSLARDLHDSVVQFLAAAAFRLEAMKRSEASGRNLEPELNELKKLMLQEQGELRSFIGALRRGSEVALNDLARDLEALAERLSKQWDVNCSFSARARDLMIPTKLHIDAQQLVREAVANAVRHAHAKSVEIALDAAPDKLVLDLINDGSEYPEMAGRLEMPDSIFQRVEQVGGVLELSRGMHVTKMSICLPIAARAA
jgi:signal transduction histidine kinase